MSDTPATYAGPPAFGDDPALFEGVIWRRMVAYTMDIFVIGLLLVGYYLLTMLAGIATFGLALPLLVALGAAVPVAYHTLMLGGPKSATLGMQMLGLEMRVWHGGRPSYLQAFLVTVIFYVSINFTAGLILLVALFHNRSRCLHDILCGTLVLRRL